MQKFSELELAEARSKSRTDFYFFSRWMFMRRKGSKWLRGPHHQLICDALTRVYLGKTKRLIINIPPRYSKTELAVINWMAWCLGAAPDSEFIHISYSARLAANNSWQCRELVSHEEYMQIFPGTKLKSDSQARDEWRTTAGGIVYATGAEGTITGFGGGKKRPEFGGAIIIDDPHKADEAKSDTIRKGVIDWFQNTLESRKNSLDTPIILIMQRLHQEDLAGWLEDGGNGEKWDLIKLPAISEGDGDLLNRPAGAPLWQETHPIEELRRMEAAAPYTFAGQYQQRPSPLAGGFFKPDRCPIIESTPAECKRWIRAWDLAATAGDGDWTVGLRLGVMPDGRYIVDDIVRDQCGPEDVEQIIKNTAARDGRSTRIRLPQDPGQAGKSQSKYLVGKLSGYRVTATLESGDKVTRSEPVAAQLNVGNVVLVKGAWNDRFIDELRSFPNAKHDDQVDALSGAFNELLQGTPMIVSDDAVKLSMRGSR